MPLEVIIVNDYGRATGGSSAVALGSARILAEMGVRVTLFTSVAPVDEQVAATPGVEVVCLNLPEIVDDPDRLRAVRHGLYNRTAAKAFDRLLSTKDSRSTIVHVHTYTKVLSAAVLHVA